MKVSIRTTLLGLLFPPLMFMFIMHGHTKPWATTYGGLSWPHILLFFIFLFAFVLKYERVPKAV